ncbi:hypothetical protein [Streptomyces sp. NPDC058308]|uniref:hypothetical protein n=1 Tax=Streptomyces sp. NPDC058308 TaxID=3346440 RepID=UPI0036EFBE65
MTFPPAVARATVFSVVSALLAVASYHFVLGSAPSWDVRAAVAAVLFCAALPLGAASAPRIPLPPRAPRPRHSAPRSALARAGQAATRRWRSQRSRADGAYPDRAYPDRAYAVRGGRRPFPAARPSCSPVVARLALRLLVDRRPHQHQHDSDHRTTATAAGREPRPLRGSLPRMLRLLCAFLARVLHPGPTPHAAVLPRLIQQLCPGRPVRPTALPLLLADTVVRRGPPARPPLAV